MRILHVAFGVACVFALGCVASEEESLDTTSQDLIAANRIAHNRIAHNKLAANRIAHNRIAHNRIAHNRIAHNRIAHNRIAHNRIAHNRIAHNRIAHNRIEANGLVTNGLMDSPDGREVFKYVIECALPDDVTLVATDSQGTEYDFPGLIGLAPGWLNHALNEKDQRWISACLFARVNAHDVSVQISMRGQSKALDTSAEERAEWSQEEGAFFGNYFVPESEPIKWYACSGRNLDVAHDKFRDCANPDPNNPGLTVCGFTYTGACSDTCESYSDRGTHYRNCAAPGDEDDDDYHQVITTFVHP